MTETADTAREPDSVPTSESKQDSVVTQDQITPIELHGPKGPEPTRFGDWERKGRCVDF